jgi:ferredoxin
VTLMRTPYFCPGCPHNQSTKVPEGSCALGGVGCHLMAVMMGRNTVTISQMGGEGAAWLGVSGHSGTEHIFANMGDGTYFHSGLLAIRAAVAGKINITYKLLFNDAVAMTGGQPVDGTLTVPQLTRQLAAEDVKRIIVMSDEPEKYKGVTDFAPGVEIRHRDELDATQRELRDTPGVTALIYDQTCAAEKRRRRKRGRFPDPAVRVFINEAVCEGCGDCSIKSNCLAVVPVETEFGRKRAIDQHSCNKDYSCVAGFCPSIVTVHGGSLRRGRAMAAAPEEFADLPEPRHGRPGRALRHPRRRRRRHRRGHHRRPDRHGRPPRRQGRHRARHDRPGAEGRRRDVARAHRRKPAAAACLAHRHRRSRAAARLRHGGRGQRRRAVEDRRRLDPRHHQHQPGDHRRIPAQSRPRLSRRCHDAGGGRCHRRRRHHPARRQPHRRAPDGQQHLDQHLHARLRLPARLRAALVGGPAARHRTQRRRSDENRRAFSWGRRHALDPARVEALVAAGEVRSPTHTLSYQPRRDRRTSARIPDVGYQDEAYARRYMDLVERTRRCEQESAPHRDFLRR